MDDNQFAERFSEAIKLLSDAQLKKLAGKISRLKQMTPTELENWVRMDAYDAATGTGYKVTFIACEWCGRLVPVQALDDFWMEQDIFMCLDTETCKAVRAARKIEVNK